MSILRKLAPDNSDAYEKLDSEFAPWSLGFRLKHPTGLSSLHPATPHDHHKRKGFRSLEALKNALCHYLAVGWIPEAGVTLINCPGGLEVEGLEPGEYLLMHVAVSDKWPGKFLGVQPASASRN